MQKIERSGVEYELPDCDEIHADWLLSMLYNVTSRRHEGQGNVGMGWRKTAIREYERIYVNTLETVSDHTAKNVASRAANLFLLNSHAQYMKMISGQTTKINCKK